MKKLNITWDGITDTTGYLFSFAKSLSCAVKNSPYSELAEDIVASSGFAFRMWIAPDLCPSATSIWSFDCQKPWTENGGLTCDYVGRGWGEEIIEEERRLLAISKIKESIDNGFAAISWDIGVPEWGLIIGYDDETQKFITLSITCSEEEMDYALLGKRELPILSILTITGKKEKSSTDIINDTLNLAKSHLKGEEWCDNAKGLEAYNALIMHIESDNTDCALSWEMEYALGTYAALKWYAWRFFDKYNIDKLCELYKSVYEYWKGAFDIKKAANFSSAEDRKAAAELLRKALKCEEEAVNIM